MFWILLSILLTERFMLNNVQVKVPGIDDDDSDANEPLTEREERKRRKMEKLRAKSRSASNLEFGDLLKLAEVQKTRVSDSSSDESESEVESDGKKPGFLSFA